MTANDLDRRTFIRTAGALLLAGSDFRFGPRTRAQDALRIAFVAGPGAPAGAAHGATLGAEDAARKGELIGRRIELVTVDSAEAGADASVTALIGGLDDACSQLANVAWRTGALAMNVGCRSDLWRAEGCEHTLFHIEASKSMYDDALAARGDDGELPGDAVLWHPSLERFGAAQLNDRFRARFGAEMDAVAWAGWMAVKVLWEASLRARTVDPARLCAYLRRDDTQFDGHKGWPLSFRDNHQLRQPLYMVGRGSDRVVGEIPVRRCGESSSRALLDTVGDDLSVILCQSMLPRG
ncbi:MAG TPA: ABC transporter substrate-binding protein [Longimicrobium sp.]